MNVLDLFSGIGGFSLGLERAGMRTVAFCEIEPYCQAVLRKHWPGVPIYDDVRSLTAERLAADGIAVDVICGGFPCQDISIAGKGDGLDGARSGLWREYFRLIRELRPRFALVENTAALLGRGLGRILCDLASIRFDAEWEVIPARAVGAQHLRERIWIVANPDCDESWGEYVSGNIPSTGAPISGTEQGAHGQRLRTGHSDFSEDVAADPMSSRLQGRRDARANGSYASYFPTRARLAELAEEFDKSYWRHQPLLGGRIHGISNRVDRVGALGNAVVPQIPEIIGRAIMRVSALTGGQQQEG